MQSDSEPVYHRFAARWVGEVRDSNWHTVLPKVSIPYMDARRFPIAIWY